MDPYIDLCRRFENAGIRYLIIGVFGINFYAEQVGQVVTTGDCDILVPAELSTLRKALRTLITMRFVLQAGNEPLPKPDRTLVQGILRARAVVRAERPDARVDLCTQIAGTGFQKLWETHREFVVEGVRIRVGRLQDLVKSKRTADRPRDRLFLEQHKEIIENMLRKQMRGRR
jgi:hypothetical protein